MAGSHVHRGGGVRQGMLAGATR